MCSQRWSPCKPSANLTQLNVMRGRGDSLNKIEFGHSWLRTTSSRGCWETSCTSVRTCSRVPESVYPDRRLERMGTEIFTVVAIGALCYFRYFARFEGSNAEASRVRRSRRSRSSARVLGPVSVGRHDRTAKSIAVLPLSELEARDPSATC